MSEEQNLESVSHIASAGVDPTVAYTWAGMPYEVGGEEVVVDNNKSINACISGFDMGDYDVSDVASVVVFPPISVK